MTTIATPPPVRTHHAERGGRVSVPGSGVPLGAQIGRALPEAFRKLAPQHLWRSPVMFLVWLGSVLTTILAVVDPSVFTDRDRGLAVADRALRQPGRGRRRGPRQGAGRHPARGPDRHHGPSAGRPDRVLRPETEVPSSQLRPGDLVRVSAGQVIPGDGDVVDGRGQRRRVGDHRRVRAGDPRGRRRPVAR